MGVGHARGRLGVATWDLPVVGIAACRFFFLFFLRGATIGLSSFFLMVHGPAHTRGFALLGAPWILEALGVPSRHGATIIIKSIYFFAAARL